MADLILTFICCSLLILSQAEAIDDWLVQDIKTQTTFAKTSKGTFQLTNGIISREFIVTPDFATVDYYSYERKQSILRAVGPEAVISLDGLEYNIGGILTDIPRAYLNRTALVNNMTYDPNAFHYAGFHIDSPHLPYPYTPKRGAPADIVWPPKGLHLIVSFAAPFGAPYYHQAVKIRVHYEMYDGIPLLVKWLDVQASPEIAKITYLSIIEVEQLAVNWPWSPQGYGWMFVESDICHGTDIQWKTDPEQSKMPGSFQSLLTCSYSTSPTLPIAEFSTSFAVQELIIGSADPERVGLAKRRKLRLLAPQTQENPIFFHMTNSTTEAFRNVIDQMAEVGFEMIIYSFGSGFDIESNDPNYTEAIRTDVAYANSKGIEVGGYDLIDWTRQVKKEWMAVNQNGACFASGWYDYLLERVLGFMNKTGVSMIETDGPYPGYTCSSTNHSHHHGLQDSVYRQIVLQSNFFTILQTNGIYINQPDGYFYQGGSKTGMGYNEHQYSLPRWQDLSVSRQGMFDDTFHYTPTVGWMFLPLVVYHGGGEDAMFEPLSKNIVEYEWGLAQYLGAGVAACYRGYRLYDTNSTKAVVSKWVSFYKKYRDILTSDIIHVKRADMQSMDSFMHVNPKLENKGLAMVFNPTDEHLSMNLTLPLYYTGLTDKALISEQAGTSKFYQLDRAYTVDVEIELPPLGITWLLVQ